MKKRITEKTFEELSSGIIGLPVSYVWQGYGTAIFLEFGELTYSDKLNHPKGEFSLDLEWSWRVENKRSILFGSFSTIQRITNKLAKLKGYTAKEIQLFGRLPEIIVNLGDKHWVVSFGTEEGQPEWALFLPDGSWIHVQNGVLYNENSQNAEQINKAESQGRARLEN